MYSNKEHNSKLKQSIFDKFDKIDSLYECSKEIKPFMKIQNIILVDDDTLSNNLTKTLIYRVSDIANVVVFKKPEDVIRYLETNNFIPDILLIDYIFNNSTMKGTELIDVLQSKKLITGSTRTIILTASSDVQTETAEVAMKPLSAEYLKENLKLDISTLQKI